MVLQWSAAFVQRCHSNIRNQVAQPPLFRSNAVELCDNPRYSDELLAEMRSRRVLH